ncbi:MAG: phosphate acyltransferase PlsX [Anaerolineae bacterium]|nr:phosphate acyltransferase PlsX [Promineifilum sp.]MCZ2115295.1 phosphate acyltransferase PlsX [Anaerolineae bacterium]
MRIVVDAMGSDHHPEPDVAGAVMAARKFGDAILLVGDEPRIAAELVKHDTTGLSIEVIHAPEAIGMKDSPSAAARDKRNSSMHVGLRLVREGAADAFVSAGNSGAILAVATLRQTGLGRIPGILRPALGVVFPIDSRPMLIDNGTNADARPEYLVQFGLMGSLYMERMHDIHRPRVALISNGEEEGKGNQLIKETIPLMEASDLNYVGNIEPKEFVRGDADVAVVDGFTGNIMMKTAEAVAAYMGETIRKYIMAGTRTKIGGLLAKPALQRVRDQLNPDEVGGAPLLGVNGVVIIAHGRSNAYAIQQAIGQARRVAEKGIVSAIAEGLSKTRTD